MNNPMMDQIEAAAEDAQRRVATLGASGNYGIGPMGDMGRAIVNRWFERGGDPEKQRMCVHVADAPQVVYSAGGLPGIATCAECFTELFDAYVAMYDKMGMGRPCDSCGNMVPMGKLGVMSVGPMLMTILWCLPCAALDDADIQNRD